MAIRSDITAAIRKQSAKGRPEGWKLKDRSSGGEPTTASNQAPAEVARPVVSNGVVPIGTEGAARRDTPNDFNLLPQRRLEIRAYGETLISETAVDADANGVTDGNATYVLNPQRSNVFELIVPAGVACTISFADPEALPSSHEAHARSHGITLVLDVRSGASATFSGSIMWPSGTPPTVGEGVSCYVFLKLSTRGSWMAFASGEGMA